MYPSQLRWKRNDFFASKRAYDDHNLTFHPPICLPTHDTNNNNKLDRYSSIIFLQPGHENLTNNWTTGLEFIKNNYNAPRPHFRSTWRRFLKGNNKTNFYNNLSEIIQAILHSHSTNDSELFWWILFHFEMLILAPTPKRLQGRLTVKQLIHQRLKLFQSGDMESLFTGTTFNNNWNKNSPRPTTREENKAAQLAADSDNYRTATTRACTFNKIATIDNSNISIVEKLYPEPTSPTFTLTCNDHSQNTHTLYLPGNICDTIRTCSKNKGTGILADSIDTFIHLIKLNDKLINENIQQLFQLVYQETIPSNARHFFTDTYLFCLHKDHPDRDTTNNGNTYCKIMERKVRITPPSLQLRSRSPKRHGFHC